MRASRSHRFAEAPADRSGRGGAMNEITVVLAMLVSIVAVAGIWSSVVKRAVIQAGTTGLLYRNGKLSRELQPGFYRWLDIGGRTKLWTVPTSPVTLPGYPLELLSKDQFSFRMTVTPVVRIADTRTYIEHLAGQDDRLYEGPVNFPSLHAALSAAVLHSVAQRTLDEFLAEPHTGLETLRADLAAAVQGAVIEGLLITAITMPPEVRKMFTEVERARREGLAALERSRAETASLRALANAARSLQGNPQLAQLRVLQAVEGSKGAKTFVLGSSPAGDLGGISTLP